MNSNEIRSRFLAFFEKRGHAILPSASLITTDSRSITNSTLFNTAGMQPLIPYLLGEPHPKGKRLADVQKCLRTVDIDDIGDNTHATFFEMLGNWSLGDYFKDDAINWSYEFLTSKDEGLGLDPKRLYITVFEGNLMVARDEEAAQIWAEIFKKNNINGERIFFMSEESNWWQAGENGPCGPDSEMYYDVMNTFNGEGMAKEQFMEADRMHQVVEVWNDVFMQYEKMNKIIVGNLPLKSVDTGAGLERLAMTLQRKNNIFDTDLFQPIMKVTENLSSDLKNQRIIADHIRASVFMISDGVIPSNTDRGYVLRRLIRRAVFNTNTKALNKESLESLVKAISNVYVKSYTAIENSKDMILITIYNECQKFEKAMAHGIKELDKISMSDITGRDAFKLFASFGFPIDMTVDIAKRKGVKVDLQGFEIEFKKHQDLSRSGALQKFKGGIADGNDPMLTRYHTATHLLHQALCDVLGNSVSQKGSNITKDRLRFDFSYGSKLTDEQKKNVENIINEKILARIPVNNVTMPINQAEKTGAKHFFGEKYGDEVVIYFIGNNLESAYSKEFCGGPHVSNTGDLAGPDGKWKFKIKKEESVAQGIRRIKAELS